MHYREARHKKLNIIDYIFFIYHIGGTIGVVNGAVVSTSDYESAGPSLIPDKGRRHTAHPGVHLPKWVGR